MQNREELLFKIEKQFLKLTNLFTKVHSIPRNFGIDELLYPSEIHTLQCIEDNSQITVTELAKIMGVTKGAVSQIKLKLKKKGLLTSKNIPKSNKLLALQLTSKGKAACEGHLKFHNYMKKTVAQKTKKFTKNDLKKYYEMNQMIIALLQDESFEVNIKNC